MTKWRLLAAMAAVVIVVMGSVVIVHEHHEVTSATRDFRAARQAGDEARVEVHGLNSDQAADAKTEHQLAHTIASLRQRLRDPIHGPIPTKTWASVKGYLDRLAPTNSTIIGLRPIRATGASPAQLIIEWQARAQQDYSPDNGLLVWTAGHTFGHPTSQLSAYRHWHVTYNWRHDGRTQSSYVGVPGHEHRTQNSLGDTFSYSVGDVTGDGTPEILGSFISGGSAACAKWRVLQTARGVTRPILWRRTCDGSVAIHDGLVGIYRATHGKECSIHGCGPSHRTLLRRVGSSWLVVSRSIVGHRVPDL